MTCSRSREYYLCGMLSKYELRAWRFALSVLTRHHLDSAQCSCNLILLHITKPESAYLPPQQA